MPLVTNARWLMPRQCGRCDAMAPDYAHYLGPAMCRRKILVMLLIGAAGAAVGLAIGIVRPAGAHVCSTPVATEVGAPVTVNVGVAVETLDPVTGVDVGIPDGFRVDEAPTDPPWGARAE